jgi:hypothetical protein
METVYFSETLIPTHESTRRHNPEEHRHPVLSHVISFDSSKHDLHTFQGKNEEILQMENSPILA